VTPDKQRMRLLRWIVFVGVAFVGLLLAWLGVALAPQSGGGAWVMALAGTVIFVLGVTRLMHGERPRR
jgi:uncharacterized membrane protein